MRASHDLSNYALPAIALLMLASTCAQAADPVAAAKKQPNVIWLYRDVPASRQKDMREGTERLFAPYGYMPGERAGQISVNASVPIDRKDRSKGTIIEYEFQLKGPEEWVGAYHLLADGTAWGTKEGINVEKLLGVAPDTEVALRFRAKGTGTVKFKIGGVNVGDFPSSLRFPQEAQPSPTKLTGTFRNYVIGPIPARDLVNLIDPFCVVAEAIDNPDSKSVRVLVDDIRLEPFKKPGVTKRALAPGWQEPLGNTLFITYTPTGFDPTANPVARPTAESIRDDLAAIRALADKVGIKKQKAGIITYGCDNGLETIAPLAKEAGLTVILGIFNPCEEAEVANVEKLLQEPDLQETIVGCCVGNEALTFRRATLDEINDVKDRLEVVRRIPMTTTEVIQKYGDARLFEFDFTLVNTHAIFADIRDAERGAKWAAERLQDLINKAPKGHMILAKELGWPAGPEPAFSAKEQAAYWRTVLAHPIARRVNLCIFDGLKNVPWKKEMVTAASGEKVNIGPHWPVLFDADRSPTPFAEELLNSWQKTRAR